MPETAAQRSPGPRSLRPSVQCRASARPTSRPSPPVNVASWYVADYSTFTHAGCRARGDRERTLPIVGASIVGGADLYGDVARGGRLTASFLNEKMFLLGISFSARRADDARAASIRNSGDACLGNNRRRHGIRPFTVWSLY